MKNRRRSAEWPRPREAGEVRWGSRHVEELRPILARFESLAHEEWAVLGTLVHARGSTYRRPGARMLVLADDTMVGLVGGGCLEGDLLERAREVRETGRAQLAVYDATREDDLVWGMGLGCAGGSRVLLERVSPAQPGVLRWLAQWRERREAGVLATALAPDHLGEHVALHADGRVDATSPEGPDAPGLLQAMRAVREPGATAALEDFALERFAPPPRLVVFGAGPDAAPVVRQAQALGWDVAVSDPRAGLRTARTLPGSRGGHCHDVVGCVARLQVDATTYALVMNHHYLRDRAVLAGSARHRRAPTSDCSGLASAPRTSS